MRKARRVRFLDKENDDLLDNEPNISPRGVESAQPRVFDAPKTSEYAFFKKIKKDGGRNYCLVQPEEGNQLKSGKSHNRKSVGTPNLLHISKFRDPDTKFSFLAEEVGATKQNSFISLSKDTAHVVKDSSSELSGNVAPFDQNVFFSPIASTSLQSGNQYFGKGIFAGKRKKLHQLAADTLLPEIEKSCSEGFDLVSTLLDRLFPKGYENNDPKLREEKIRNCHQLPACSISDVPEAKLDLIRRKRSRELENESTWDDFTPRYSSSSAKRIFISEADHSLAICDAKPIFRDEVANHNYMSDPKVIRSWCRQSDSSLGLPYEKYGHTGSFHIQELSEHYDPFEASIRDPHNLLIGWDFNRHEREPDFYSPASGIEEHMYSRTLREFHNQQIVDDELDESAFSRLSFFSQYSPQNNLFPHCHDTNLHTWDIRELEYDSSEHLGQGQFSSRLSYSPKYLTSAEDHDTDDAIGSGSIVLSGQDHPLHISNFFSQKHWHLSRGLDFDLGWKCLSASNLPGEIQLPTYHAFRYPLKREISQYCKTEGEQEYYSPIPRESFVSFSEGQPSYEDQSFGNSLNRVIGRPLLLDYSSWNRLLDDDDDDR